MSVLDNILKNLDEMYILTHVTMKHDDARISYKMSKNTVSDDEEFDDVSAEYYNHQFSKCISKGGPLPRFDALGNAKEIIRQECRNKGRDISYAYSNGKTGAHGGMFVNINYIYEHLKHESLERHIRSVLDDYVAPTSFEEQVSLIKDIFFKFNVSREDLDINHPELYAKNYERLVHGLATCIFKQAFRYRRVQATNPVRGAFAKDIRVPVDNFPKFRNLEELLEKIDPSNTIDVIEKKIYSRVATYHREKNIVDSKEEFEDCLAEMYALGSTIFYKNRPLKYTKERHKSFIYPPAYNYLAEKYGDYDIAYKIMSKGVEGGVFGVLQIFCQMQIDKFCTGHIGHYVDKYFENLSYEKSRSDCKEYIKQWQHILPIKEITISWFEFKQILKEHPFILKKYRELN
jgi:hypothetical protein